MREIHKVPHNQKIVDEAHVANDGKLIEKPFTLRIAGMWHFTAKTFFALARQKLEFFRTVRRNIFGQVPLAKGKLNVALSCDLGGIVDGILIVAQNRAHFLLTLEIELIGSHFHAVVFIHVPRGLDAQKHILRFGVIFVDVMKVVCGHGFDRKLLGERIKLW